MATGKRFYWMKLKESFMTSDTIDYFMSQPDGANYVVLYQMLCLKTINTGGRFSRQIGEIIIPYDVEKIARDCKWFSADTVRVALNLYKAFGLIYEDQDGVLVIADHAGLVGSETDYAAQKKVQRKAPMQQALPMDSGVDNVHENVHTDIRDKDIRDKDIRDKDIRDKRKDVEQGDLTISNEIVCCTRNDVQQVISAWNTLGLAQITKISPDSNRGKWLRKRMADYGMDEVLRAIENIRGSKFLMGENKTGWQITFDWFIKPNNFPKVLDGNYDNRNAGVMAKPQSYADIVAEMEERGEL